MSGTPPGPGGRSRPRVLIVGASGDLGERLTHALATSGAVGTLAIAGSSAKIDTVAAAVATAHDVTVHAERADCRDAAAVATLLTRHEPDLVLQCASLMSPWALYGRSDAAATAFARAGLAVRLPLQLPVLLATMQAARAVGFDGPVANLSLPDLTNPMLAAAGPAPTVGLGNVAMLLVRARAALRRELGPDAEMPLLRVAGQHHHVFAALESRPPADPSVGPWVWVGDDSDRGDGRSAVGSVGSGGRGAGSGDERAGAGSVVRRDDLSYTGPPLAAGAVYNTVTAAASLPVLLALLPGAAPLRWSTAAPLGLAGGFPVRNEDRTVTLDLPAGVDLADCQVMCEREARGDGVDRIDPDGTVHFTADARAALADLAPDLVEPLALADVDRRAARILTLLR